MLEYMLEYGMRSSLSVCHFRNMASVIVSWNCSIKCSYILFLGTTEVCFLYFWRLEV